MKRRLFSEAATTEADVRPTLLGVVTLLFLLLFFLLSTSSGQRLGVIDLRLGTAADLAPLPHAGLVQSLEVRVEAGLVSVVAEIQSTDIAAAATSLERREFALPAREGRPDLAGLARIVGDLHGLDPAQTHARLHPDDGVDTATLVALLDVLRGPSDLPHFPDVALVGVEG